MLIVSKKRYCYINQKQLCGYYAKDVINEFIKEGERFRISFDGIYTSNFIEQTFSNINNKENIFNIMELDTNNDLIYEIIYNILKENNNTEKIKTK